jgi:hypothetical protein
VNVERAAGRLGILNSDSDFSNGVVLLRGYEIVAEGHRDDFSRRQNVLRLC